MAREGAPLLLYKNPVNTTLLFSVGNKSRMISAGTVRSAGGIIRAAVAGGRRFSPSSANQMCRAFSNTTATMADQYDVVVVGMFYCDQFIFSVF